MFKVLFLTSIFIFYSKVIGDYVYDNGRPMHHLIEEMEEKSLNNIREYKRLVASGVNKTEALISVRGRNLPAMCSMPNRGDSLCEEKAKSKYRTLDGTCNHLNTPLSGSIYMHMNRHFERNYEDGVTDIRRDLPNPRLISTMIHKDENIPEAGFTNMVTAMGQFFVHDIALTPFVNEDCCQNNDVDKCARIDIPSNDTFYSSRGQTCLTIKRSVPYCFPIYNTRDPMKVATTYIDLSQVYGTHKYRADQIREFNKGRLRVSKDGRNLLPSVEEIFNDTGSKVYFGNDARGKFVAGDDRVNLTPDLTALHIIFMREHNRIANEIWSLRGSWSDETIYQETRRIMIAQWEKIVINDYFRKIMGNYLEANYNGSYTDYNDHNQPNIYDDLLMGSLRFGHSLAQGRMNFGANGSFLLRDHYNRHDVMFLDFEDLIRGLFQQNSQKVDRHVSEDLTNFLNNNKDSNKNYGEDLVARNIQRGREVGLLPYYRYRKRWLNLDFPTSWNERPADFSEDQWRRLREVYRSPLDIDYFTGGLMENRDSNLLLSKTFLWSLHNYFLNVVRADRYFYTHRNQVGSFTQPQLDEINKRTLGMIICDNMPKMGSITRDVFIPLSNNNPLIGCGEAPKLNIKIFLD